MTTPEIEPEIAETPDAPEAPDVQDDATVEQADERKRRWLLLLLLLLLVCLCCTCGLFFRYLQSPQPLPDILIPTQVAATCYAPTYKFSVNNIDGPVAVALSPDNQRIYVAESKGERLVKVFDRDGKPLFNFAPPGTDKSNREAKYMAIDKNGRVYLVDRTSNAIDIYDADGKFIDAIIGQHTTLSKFLAGQTGALPANVLPTSVIFTHYEGINKVLSYLLPGDQQVAQTVKVTFPADEPQWSPLGLRFDPQGNLIYTDSTTGLHSIHIIPAADLNAPLDHFNPQIKAFGVEGKENGQFEFPQSVVVDGKGNYYVSDGNNTRISVWTPDMQYKTFFGFGTLSGALNLPRGLWMNRNCLHVADAVGSYVRVYDVSGAEPAFAFQIGGFGISEGTFSYPIDLFIDGTGRLYIADRENNRIQIWSY